MEKIEITLPRGGILEVEATQDFLEKVRSHFNLRLSDDVDNDHIRMFIFGSLQSAVEKAEKNH
tara:strand:+ start:377 stop:565 length:189 start_codon:yes stop_codon:yes gene_type:complete